MDYSHLFPSLPKGNRKECGYVSNLQKDWLYAFCIILRCSVGLWLVYWAINMKRAGVGPETKTVNVFGYSINWSIIDILISITCVLLISFYMKFQKCAFLTWKNYLRFLIIYLMIAVCFVMTKWTGDMSFIVIAGTLVIVDALMGMQTKFVHCVL
jgi:hypothetical protein